MLLEGAAHLLGEVMHVATDWGVCVWEWQIWGEFQPALDATCTEPLNNQNHLAPGSVSSNAEVQDFFDFPALYEWRSSYERKVLIYPTVFSL